MVYVGIGCVCAAPNAVATGMALDWDGSRTREDRAFNSPLHLAGNVEALSAVPGLMVTMICIDIGCVCAAPNVTPSGASVWQRTVGASPLIQPVSPVASFERYGTLVPLINKCIDLFFQQYEGSLI